MKPENSQDTASRRTILQAATVASAAAAAGCLGGGGDDVPDESDLGERVPSIELNFPSDLGAWTDFHEVVFPTLQSNIEEALNIDVSMSGKSFNAIVSESTNDERTHHVGAGGHSMRPSRLDPNDLLLRHHIMNAGDNGLSGENNYANCEYSELMDQQTRTPDPDQRQEVITEALSILSEETGFIPVCEWVIFSAYRTDMIDLADPGSMGFSEAGFYPLFESEAIGDADQMVMNTQTRVVSDTSFVTGAGASEIYPLSNTLYSPLLTFDQNFELTTVLAEDFQVSDDNLTITLELEDATFHNGDPITSEDVAWTFQFSREQGEEGNWPEAPTTSLESIDTPDDTTVVFNLEDPVANFVTVDLTSWGILPKDVLIDAGVEDDPLGFDDPRIGSGPYQFSSWEQDSFIALEPFDGHPKFTPQSDLVLNAIEEPGTALRAFEEGEINLLQQTTGDFANQIEDELSDVAEVVLTDGFTTANLRPQCSYGPTKFSEFRKAISQLVDRQEANQVSLFGEGEPAMYATPLATSHPFFPEDEDVLAPSADSPSANIEAAIDELESEGWHFDGNGDLRYPADADLTPLWPEGSEPSENPDDFPCVDDMDPV